MNNKNNSEEKDPIRLVDPDDKSLTLLNTDVHKPEFGKRDYDLSKSEDFTEETSTEFPATFGTQQQKHVEQEEAPIDGMMNGRAMGIFAIILSLLSLFILPILLGAAGIIVGGVARRGEAKAIGNWAIGIGVISIVASLFFRRFI